MGEVIDDILNTDVVIFVWNYGISDAKKTDHKLIGQVDALSRRLAANTVNLKNIFGLSVVYFTLLFQFCFSCKMCPHTYLKLISVKTLAAPM